MPTPVERINTLFGLVAKRNELVAYRDQLEVGTHAMVCEIDHQIFNPENTPARALCCAT